MSQHRMPLAIFTFLVLANSAIAASTPATVRLFGAFGFGQGCPVASRYLLTARHLAAPEGGSFRPARLIWVEAGGASGTAIVRAWDERRDVALLETDQPLTIFYPRTQAAPALKTRVTIFGYDAGRGFAPRAVRTEIINLLGPFIVLKDAAGPGFSGSCVLNAKSEIVGILHWSVGENPDAHSLASGVWGAWGEWPGMTF